MIDDVFAVIAEGTRREILASLRTGDKAVGELVDELSVSQPTVSKHLKVLREAGLVSMRAQGQKRFYSLETEPLELVAGWLADFPLDALHPQEAALDLAVSGLSPAPTPDVAPVLTTALDTTVQHQIGRTVRRASERASDLLANLPKLRRRKD